MKKFLVIFLIAYLFSIQSFGKTTAVVFPKSEEDIQLLFSDFKDLKGAYRFVSIITSDHAFEKEWLRFLAQKGFNPEREYPKTKIDPFKIEMALLKEPIQKGASVAEYWYKGKSFYFDVTKSPEYNLEKIQMAWGDFEELKNQDKITARYLSFVSSQSTTDTVFMNLLTTLGIHSIIGLSENKALGLNSWYSYRRMNKNPQEVQNQLNEAKELPMKAYCFDRSFGVEKGNVKFGIEPIDKNEYKAFVQTGLRRFQEMDFKLLEYKNQFAMELVSSKSNFWLYDNGMSTEVLNLVLKMKEICSQKNQIEKFNTISANLFTEKKQGNLILLSDSPLWKPEAPSYQALSESVPSRLPASKK